MKCTPGNKKSAKLVRGLDGKMHCVRYGDKNMSIKKHIPSRRKSFCARHKCTEKKDPATPGYQSCLAWSCEMGTRRRIRNRDTRRKARRGTRDQKRRKTRTQGSQGRSRRSSTRKRGSRGARRRTARGSGATRRRKTRNR